MAANPDPIEHSSPAFQNWFGDSKVVHPDGTPRLVYHGTIADIAAFNLALAGTNDHGWYGKGVYLSADPGTASAYTNYDNIKSGGKLNEQAVGGNVMPVYVSLQNPYIWPKGRAAATTAGERDSLMQEFAAAGHDGVIVPNAHQDPQFAEFHEIVVFDPTRIKSAIGNIGDFDVCNPDVRFSFPDDEPAEPMETPHG